MPELEQQHASTHIDAPPAAVFAFLCEPANHERTEPTDWVRDAIDTEPLTGLGQMFGMNMYKDFVGGHYTMQNKVTAFEPDRAIAWHPGSLDENGDYEAGGWSWRYDIEPEGEGSRVTLTYDWTDTPQEFRDRVRGMPPYPAGYLEESVASLAAALGS